MDAPALHQALEPVAFLLGTWQGEGTGFYPTIERFDYREDVRFWHVGKPFLAYAQRTWSLGDGSPLHSETGYWRPQPNGGIEVVLSHPFGVAEVQVGRVEGARITMESLAVSCAPSAKLIEGVSRRYIVEGDTLSYEVEMSAVGEPLQPHLRAELKRVDA